jgi:enoyl-CoA hydratase
MGDLVTYRLEDAVATLTMDDGKVNALSPEMLAALTGAFDQAETDRATVVLRGRPGIFSAGFSLPVLRAGGPDAAAMLLKGFEVAERMLTFPSPVLVACTGHAIAMGSFLLLSGDYRLGAEGEFKVTANEVAIGMTMPYTAIEICRRRLAPAHFDRAVVLAEVYTPTGAVAAGFLDKVVAVEQFDEAVAAEATRLSGLNMYAHAATKSRARAGALDAVRRAVEHDRAAFQGMTD